MLVACGILGYFAGVSAIWPQPAAFTTGSQNVTLNPVSWQFITKTPTADITNAFQRYQPLIFPHKVATPTGPALTSISVTVVDTSVELQLGVDESYTLDVSSSGATITANTVYGLYHGLESFSQLVLFDFDTEQYYVASTPYHIEDAPRFPHRGVLIDSSRHFEPVNTIKAVIDSVTYAKINVIHWHIVDSQSFPFDSSSYPKLARGAYSQDERYTVADVAEVVEYARQRGVRVMAEIDNPGHAASWCVGYPEVCPRTDCTEPLNPATNATFDLIDGLLQDMTGGKRGAGLFFENLFHLGGDEVNTNCWTSTPEIASWMAQQGFTADQTYMYFVQRSQAIAHSKGRDVVGWEEIWRHFGTKLDKSTIIHQWLPGSTVAPEVTNAGYRLLWSTDGIWYLDGLSVSWQTMYQAEPCSGVSPDNCKKLVLGGEGCMWGETVDTSDIQQTIWPRLAAIAERLWSPEEVKDVQAAAPRYAGFRCLLNRRGVAAAPSQNQQARQAPPHPGACGVQ